MIWIVSLSSTRFCLICRKILIFRFFWSWKIFDLLQKCPISISLTDSMIFYLADLKNVWIVWFTAIFGNFIHHQVLQHHEHPPLVFNMLWWIKVPKIAINPTYYTFLTSAGGGVSKSVNKIEIGHFCKKSKIFHMSKKIEKSEFLDKSSRTG